jgi:Cd2+/Zn2+-exporting ATPase
LKFKVHEMCCAEEVGILRKKIGKLAGDENRIVVDILSKTLTVLPGQLELSQEEVIVAVAKEGMLAEIITEVKSMKRSMSFRIPGMDCMEEIYVLKREIGQHVGGDENLNFDLFNKKMTIKVLPIDLSEEIVINLVAKTGMKAIPWDFSLEVSLESQPSKHLRSLSTILCGVFTVIGLVQHGISGSWFAAFGLEEAASSDAVPLISKICYCIAIICGSWRVAPKAWLSVKRFMPDMNLLMTMAVLGAVIIGQWFEAATVVFLFSLSLMLEAWSMERARKAISSLLDLSPMMAILLDSQGKELETRPIDIPIGSSVLIKPGEKIPLDGNVMRGESDVNQAPISGESTPVVKSLGDPVFAGSINGNGALVIQTSKLAEDSTLSRILQMVQEAQAKRSPSEKWVEKFALVYTPAILILAISIFLFPPLFLQGSWIEWFYKGLVLLVIGCPCALVISTPVSIMASLAASAKNGLLVKGGVHLETPSKLKVIAFDKTGTLTEGKPTIAKVVALNGHTVTELIERAAALEAHSTHPLAVAIVAYAKSHGISIRPAEKYQILQGKGATGEFQEGKQYWVGSHKYLEERGQETTEVHTQLEALTTNGHSVVVVGNETHVCGFISLTDKPRANAKAVILELRSSGIVHIVMLSGDNKGTADAIGKELGLDGIHSELLPEDKIRVVEELETKFGRLAMVGDGVNDAPALARASLSIAMGGAGSDAAIEVADVTLMSDDLSKIPWLIHHSKRTMIIIRQNIGFALGIKLLFVILTLAGYSSLWGAIAADMGASFIVIFNGLRLLTSPLEV